jgi:putative SOS response-associated peptidase YedK
MAVMCGRFVASRPASELAELLDVAEISAEAPDGTPALDDALQGAPPSWNVAPQAAVWAVTAKQDDAGSLYRRMRRYHWGLVPSWSAGPSSGARAFNARAESIFDNRMFATALERRRCIVPADAFYEWEKTLGTGGRVLRRQPWLFEAPDRGILAFAGLWEFWRERSARDGEEPRLLRSCTIITSASTGAVASIHDRMPVLLPRETWADWLAPGALDPAEVSDLLAPAPEEALVGFTVSQRVNDGRVDDPDLIEPLDLADAGEQTLFDLGRPAGG